MSLAASAPDRHAVYAGLMRRNRLVGVLRVAVPLAGALILAAILAAMVIGGLSARFGFADIAIDRDNLVVDAPRLSATAVNDNTYSFSAAEARAAVGSLDTVEVTGGDLTLRYPDGTALTASYDHAELQTGRQVVTIHGTATISGTDGTAGTVSDVVWDVPNQRLRASGALDVTLPRGTRIKADALAYDASAGVWRFTRAEVTLPGVPGAPK